MTSIDKLKTLRLKVENWSVNEALFGNKKTTDRLDKLEKELQLIITDLEKDDNDS